MLQEVEEEPEELKDQEREGGEEEDPEDRTEREELGEVQELEGGEEGERRWETESEEVVHHVLLAGLLMDTRRRELRRTQLGSGSTSLEPLTLRYVIHVPNSLPGSESNGIAEGWVPWSTCLVLMLCVSCVLVLSCRGRRLQTGHPRRRS